MIGDIAEHIRHWHLKEQTYGCHCIAFQLWKSKASYDRWSVCVESSEGAVVKESDEDVKPYLPIAELDDR